MSSKQFHIFHASDNLSSDQIVLISDEVEKRRRILRAALENLRQAMVRIEPRQEPAQKPAVNKTSPKQLVKKPDTTNASTPDSKALKGRVTYKVKGPDGRPMNIAEIKHRINSIYDGKQGIIKQ